MTDFHAGGWACYEKPWPTAQPDPLVIHWTALVDPTAWLIYENAGPNMVLIRPPAQRAFQIISLSWV